MEKRIILNNLETPFWIDSSGRLRNEKTQNWLKGAINKGYHFYNIYFKGKQYTLYTHKLVAEYFLPNPNNFTLIHHKDENKLNNNYLNLEWTNEKLHGQIHGKGYNKERIKVGKEELNLSELKQFRNSPYWVSRFGIVYNLDKCIQMRFENSGNYYRISCAYNLKGKHFLVHRMVWESFNGPIPKGMEINHIDSNPHNNALDNLELLTHSNNCKKAKHKNIPIYSIDLNSKERKEYSSLSEASRDVLGSRGSMAKIKKVIETHQVFQNKYWYYKE